MEPHRPRLIFANLANELDFAVATPDTCRGDVPLEARELAFAHPGDLIVTSHPIPQDFFHYLLGTLIIDPATVINISTSARPGETLTASIRRNGLTGILWREVQARGGAVFAPYAIDRPTLELAFHLGTDVFGYGGFPDKATMDTVYELSNKAGFRKVAPSLGLPIVRGMECEGIEGLVDAVEELAPDASGVIVKLKRGSSGYGNLILEREECSGPGLRAALVRHLDAHVGQPEQYVVEELACFVRTPSLQMFVGESGSTVDFLCDMRCQAAAFRGVVVPCLSLPRNSDQVLLESAERFGSHLRARGFRGYCDLDAGVLADGRVFFTETNLRRTGATYAQNLVRRLCGTIPGQSAWLTDARRSHDPSLDFRSAVSSLNDANLAFDRESHTGVLLTADSVQSDGKWRYLVIGSDIAHAAEIEDSLARRLCLNENQSAPGVGSLRCLAQFAIPPVKGKSGSVPPES
jgi:hypothetical protein